MPCGRLALLCSHQARAPSGTLAGGYDFTWVSSVASNTERIGRTPEQRLSLRFPPVAQALATTVFRLPPGSRLRRAWLERSVRISFDAWVRGDYEVLRAQADPNIEVHVEQASGRAGFEVPVGLEEIYHGPDGYCESMQTWAQSFKNWRAEVEEVVEEGPGELRIVARHSGEGIASGVKLEQWGAIRYTVRSGRIVRVVAFFGPNRAQAVQAMGDQ
jgi:ketosteroid isomerase-like protein